jgi:predicted TIM-barrel fold metal-dependent hydrolase
MGQTIGIVDCHFHVIAPPDECFPMLPGRSYTPPPAVLSQWRAVLAPHGVTHGVVVQPSFYGTDNRVLLAALAEAGEPLVGIAAVAADVPDEELDRLAAARVRGVRMAHFEAGDQRAMGGFVPFGAFDALEPRLAQRGMHLQLFTDSRLLPAIADRLRRSTVPVVIDHMGRAPAALGAAHAGIQALRSLMTDGPVWVKLSGVGNISDCGPAYQDAGAVHRALLDAAPDRMVWGSDWPHTRPGAERPATAHLLELARGWTAEAMRERLFWRNAIGLYRFPAA